EAAVDDRSDVRRASLIALGALAGPNDATAITRLVKSVGSDKDDVAQGLAALSLGRTHSDAAPAALRAAYGSGSSVVRAFASLGLGLYVRGRPDGKVSDFLLTELEARHDAYETGALCIANGLARNLA